MAKKKVAVTNDTTRTIYFYQLVHSQSEEPLTKAELTELFKDIKTVTLNRRQAYMQVDNNDVARAWVDSISGAGCELKFGITRRSSLPPIELDGVLEELNLRPDQGLSELIHVIAYPNAVFGIEFNFYGPRPSKLSTYFYNKTGKHVKFLNLISKESAVQLARFGSLTRLNLKVKSNVVDEIRQVSESVGGMLEKINEFNGVNDIEVNISAKKREDGILDIRLLKGIKAIYKNFTEWDSVKKLVIEGNETSTNQDLELDLLKEHLLSRQHVIKVSARSRQIESESAYKAIERAKNELKEEIERSAGGKLS